MLDLHQWDVVHVRINPEDKDEHPAVVVSPEEICADVRRPRLNVLYGTTRRPGASPYLHDFVLDGADGLDHPTLFTVSVFYLVERSKIRAVLGRVTPERRRGIGRKIVGVFRFPLG